MEDQPISEDYSDDVPADPYSEGRRAYVTGAANPYRPRTADWDDWNCGYGDGRHSKQSQS